MTMILRLIDRINGKRGGYLLCHAIIFTVIGVSFLQIPSAGVRQAAFWWLPGWLPFKYLGIVWIVAAGLAAAFSFRNGRRFSDKFGFQAVWLAPALFAGNYGVAWLTGHAPTGYLSFVIYGGYAAGVMIVASWSNPIAIPTPPQPRES